MKLLHITKVNVINTNGVVSAIKNYMIYENKYADVGIYNLDQDFECSCNNIFNIKDYSFIDKLPSGFDKPDLVIFNEVYKMEYIKMYRYLLINKIPYIIIPHGSLVKKAQNNKWLKKRIGNILLFGSFIKNAAALQFLNESEKAHCNFKYKKYIISGNGISKFLKSQNRRKNRDLVFIGRYSIYTKGLDILINICNEYKEWFKNQKIFIKLYGSSNKKEVKKLKKMVSDNNLNDLVIINNPIYDEEKEKVLKDSYCFIQLSRHEGQPMGIVEALSLGLPCIVSEGTTFASYVNDNKCGYGVVLNEKDIFSSIQKMYSNEKKRDIFSKNSIESIKKDFNLKIIIKDLLIEYKKIIEGSDFYG